MEFFQQLGKGLGAATNFFAQHADNYIAIDSSSNQLIFRQNSVLHLCRQVVDRVEKIVALEPDSFEGFIATIKHQNIELKAHFVPERISYKNGFIKGQIRLISKIDCRADSFISRTIVAAWKTFLGGRIPNQALPEGIRCQKNLIYYQFPAPQLNLMDALLNVVGDRSAVDLSVTRGELFIKAAVNWDSIDIWELLKAVEIGPSSLASFFSPIHKEENSLKSTLEEISKSSANIHEAGSTFVGNIQESSSLSDKELIPDKDVISLFAVLFAVAAVDGVINEDEMSLIMTSAKAKHLTADERKILQDYSCHPPSLEESLQKFSMAEQELKFGLMFYIINLTWSDGVVAQKEKKAIAVAQNKLGINDVQTKVIRN